MCVCVWRFIAASFWLRVRDEFKVSERKRDQHWQQAGIDQMWFYGAFQQIENKLCVCGGGGGGGIIGANISPHF